MRAVLKRWSIAWRLQDSHFLIVILLVIIIDYDYEKDYD
ncbi:MAG: hypothetical protein ACI9OU_001364 [Candidatus Promineifilaceae bacterium]|jgi:hypothetical protein